VTIIPPEVLDQIKAELRRQFEEEGLCPVCGQKKRPAYSDERRKKLSDAMKIPRKRESPTTTRILIAIKEAPATFSLADIVERSESGKNTVREIVRRLIIAGEITTSGNGDSRNKTSIFGNGDFWKRLESDGNIPLKMLPAK
jgi:hypothetical protein